MRSRAEAVAETDQAVEDQSPSYTACPARPGDDGAPVSVCSQACTRTTPAPTSRRNDTPHSADQLLPPGHAHLACRRSDPSPHHQRNRAGPRKPVASSADTTVSSAQLWPSPGEPGSARASPAQPGHPGPQPRDLRSATTPQLHFHEIALTHERGTSPTPTTCMVFNQAHCDPRPCAIAEGLGTKPSQSPAPRPRRAGLLTSRRRTGQRSARRRSTGDARTGAAPADERVMYVPGDRFSPAGASMSSPAQEGLPHEAEPTGTRQPVPVG